MQIRNSTEYAPRKLVVPYLLAREFAIEYPLPALESRFGTIDYVSSPLAFTFTDYYEAEMGPDLRRVFVSFRELIDPSRLAEVKRSTIAAENTARIDGKRIFNLDPGLLSLHNFILASTKDHMHRIPLRDGIYAELTLLYRHKAFQACPWTYPDYRSPEYHHILHTIRDTYHAQLKPND